MKTNYVLICTLLVSGCTLGAEPEVPSAPEPVALPISSEPITAPSCPLDTVQITLLAPNSEPVYRTPRSHTATKKGERPLRPAEVVAQAQKAARIEPSERGYYGGSGEQVYAWTTGKVYTVYLSKQQATGIFLPPSEKLVSGLYLDPESYEVKVKRAGIGDSAYDAVMIRPMIDKGEVQAFLLTESGRRYLLHFVVGSTGMLAVTFEGTVQARQATQARTEEPPLILPRPPGDVQQGSAGVSTHR